MNAKKFISEIDFTKAPQLNFLKRLTNQTGIIQHTKYAVPDRNLGYSVDDNARALIAAVEYHQLFNDEAVLDLAVIFLSFVHHSKTKAGWFYNFLTFDNKFLDQAHTEDGFGRVFWALGYTVAAKARRDLTLSAENLVNDVKDNIYELKAPRAIAYTLIGLYYLSTVKFDNSTWEDETKLLAGKLVNLYKKNKTADWKWFEPYMTYANGILPYSLALAGKAVGNKEYLEIATESLEFLDVETTTNEGVPSPIGQDGWYFKGKKKATFDQQPLEAADMVLAYLAIFNQTKNNADYLKAEKWFAWYLGFNVKKIEVYDSITKGCFDGINSDGVNLNQGAESILAFLLAYLAFSEVEINTK